ALSHAIFPGVVIAFLLRASFFAGALAFGVLTAVSIGALARNRKVSEDTAIGVLFAGMFALGIVLISTISGYTADLASFLFGDVLGQLVSYHTDLAAGGTIVLVVTAWFGVSLLAAPRHGLLGRVRGVRASAPARVVDASPVPTASRSND